MQRVRTYLALVRVLLIADVVGSSCSWRTGPSNRSFGGDFMRLLSKIAAGVAVCALIGFMPVRAEALALTPADAECDGTGNPDEITFLVTECGATAPLTFQYKSNVGGSDEGPFAGSYNTAYFNTPTDPEDATISWVNGQPVINCITAD